jgi:hypothetical protein
MKSSARWPFSMRATRVSWWVTLMTSSLDIRVRRGNPGSPSLPSAPS